MSALTDLEITCSKCKVSKSSKSFGRDSSQSTGFRGRCKSCRSEINKRSHTKYYLNNKEKESVRNARYYLNNKEKVATRVKTYSQTKEGKLTVIKATEKWQKDNPKKVRAKREAAYAIKTGQIIRCCCEICGVSETGAHHDDYDHPLVVRFLCIKHHKQWHLKNGSGKNG